MALDKKNMLFIVSGGKNRIIKWQNWNGLGIFYARQLSQYKENHFFFNWEKTFTTSMPLDVTVLTKFSVYCDWYTLMVWVYSFGWSREKAWFTVVILNHKTPQIYACVLGFKRCEIIAKESRSLFSFLVSASSSLLFIPSGFYFSIKRASSTGSSWSRHGLVFSQC